MNLTKKLLVVIALLKIVGLSQAMEEAKKQVMECKPVKLPSASIIKQRLEGLGLEYFIEKTEIDVELGDQEKHPIEVLVTVKESLADYKNYIKDKPSFDAVYILKPRIIRAILQDSPEAIIAFEKIGILEQAKK